MLDRVEGALDRLGLRLMEWWVWPALLVGVAVAVLVGGWVLQPGPHEVVTLFGRPAFGTCPYLAATGVPCGQCGTTRALVWAARGRWWTAFRYNPAAFAAWVWAMAGAAVGSMRLIRRDPSWGRASWTGLAAVALGWVALYGGAYAARLAGLNPLP